MFVTLLLVAFYMLTPVGLIYLTQRFSFFKKAGAVVLAYLLGLLLGSAGLLPRGSETYQTLLGNRASMPDDELMQFTQQGLLSDVDALANQIGFLQDLIMTIVIPLAIPLLLFSIDLRRWLRLAREAMFSLLLAMISLLAVVLAGYFLFRNHIPEAWKVSGMLVGIYTGGTPNLAAISTALHVEPAVFILTHTYDMMLGAVCLMFLLSSAQRVFNRFLPRFKDRHKQLSLAKMIRESEDIDDFRGMLAPDIASGLFRMLGLSALIFAFAGGLSLLVPKSAQMVTVILTITSLGLAVSNIPSVNRIKKTFQLGMYLILVFSLVVASMSDLRSMFQIDFLHLFLFVVLGVFGSMLIHVFLSWIFRVDSDTTIITITALTFSPPFVPAVAGALRNKDVIISGLTVGILGYAFGNYLGVAIAFFLKGL